MAKLHISPGAKDDLHGIKEYIKTELENPVAAGNTISKITKSIRGLKDFPDIGTPLTAIVDIPNNYRFLVCGSYLIFYRYEDDSVYVARVLYGKRDYLKILLGNTSADEMVE